MEIQKKIESRNETVQNRAALLILVFVVAIGIPVWWKTTEIPRATLPYQQISDLPDLDNEFKFIFRIVEQEILPILSFREELLRIWDPVKAYTNISVDILIGMSEPSAVQHNEIVLLLKRCTSEEISLVNSTIHVCWGDNTKQILLKFFSDYTQSLVSKELTSNCLFPSVHGVQVSFTYILPFELREEMLSPFYQDVNSFFYLGILPLREFINVTADSQIYHFSPIPEFIHREQNKFHISQRNVSQVVNKIESNLNSYTTQKRKLNFLVYTPTKEYHPLSLLDSTGESFSSAVVEDWGSLLLTGSDSEFNYTSILSAAVHYLKLELKFPYVINNDMQIPDQTSVFTKLELNPWFYKQTHCYHSKAKRSLNALTKTLSEVPNMFINTDIQQSILSALEHLQVCREEYKRGNLEAAHRRCREGWEESENAYYDPSIIQLLYFPDDQKYAIYVPLFLPIGVILLRSIPGLWRWVRGVKN